MLQPKKEQVVDDLDERQSEKEIELCSCSGNVSVVQRSLRQAKDDPLPTTIHRMQIVSGATKAIYLQRGLMDKSLDPLNVATDLLGLGKIDLDGSTIRNVLEEVKALPGKLNKDDNTKKAGAAYAKTLDLKVAVDGVKDVNKWTEQDEFKADLEKWKLELPILKELADEVERFKALSKEIADAARKKKEERTQIYFESILERISYLESVNLANSTDKTLKLPSGKTMTESYSDMKALFEAVSQYAKFESDTKVVQDTWQANIKANVETMSSIKIGNTLDHLKTIETTLVNRKPSFKDLENLQLKDSWFVLRGDLTNFLSPIKIFVERLKKPADELNQFDGKFGEIKEVIQGFSANVDPSVIDEVFKCLESAPFRRTINVTAITPVHSDILDLEEKVEDLEVGLKKISDWVKQNQETFDKVKAIAAKATSPDKALLESVVAEYVEFAQEKNLTKVFADFKEVEKFGNTDSVKDLLKKVVDQLPTLDLFQPILDLFPTTFGCLQGVDLEKAKAVNETIAKSEELKISNELKADMDKVNSLVGTIQNLKNISAVPEEMKKAETPESQKLSLLKDPGLHSNVTDTATRGIENMKDVLDHQKTIDQISQLSDTVPSMKEDLQKVLAVNNNLTSWKSGIKLPDSMELVGYSQIFLDAGKVGGVKDLEKMLDTVKTAEAKETDPAIKKNLGELGKALEELLAVGLDFSKYKNSFDLTGSTLKVLDEFFAELFQKTGVAPIQNGTAASVLANPADSATSYSYNWIYWTGGAILVSAGLTTGALYIFSCCCFKYNGVFYKKVKPKPARSVDLISPRLKKREGEMKKTMPAKREGSKQPDDPTPRVSDMKKKSQRKAEENSEAARAKTMELMDDKHREIAKGGFETQLLGYHDKFRWEQAAHAMDQQVLIPMWTLRFLANEIRTLYKQGFTPGRKITRRRMEQNRNQYYVKPESAVVLNRNFYMRCRYQDSYINANWLTMQNDALYVLAETPKYGITDDKFMYMIAQMKADVVVALYDQREYTAGSGKGEQRYGNYLPESVNQMRTFERNYKRLIVECIEKETASDGSFCRRKIRLTYSNPNGEVMPDQYPASMNEKQKKLEKTKELLCPDFDPNRIDHVYEHYEISNWSEEVPPLSTASTRKVLRAIKNKPRVIVTCNDGVQRSLPFTGLVMALTKLFAEVGLNVKTPYVDLYSLLLNISQNRSLRQFPSLDGEDEIWRTCQKYGLQTLFMRVVIIDQLWAEGKLREEDLDRETCRKLKEIRENYKSLHADFVDGTLPIADRDAFQKRLLPPRQPLPMDGLEQPEVAQQQANAAPDPAPAPAQAPEPAAAPGQPEGGAAAQQLEGGGHVAIDIEDPAAAAPDPAPAAHPDDAV